MPTRASEYELLAKCLGSRIDWLRVNYIKLLLSNYSSSLSLDPISGSFCFFYEIDLILLIFTNMILDISYTLHVTLVPLDKYSGDVGSQGYSLINSSPSYASVQSRHAVGFSCLDRLCYIAIGEYQISDQTCSATWLSYETWNFRILSRADLN